MRIITLSILAFACCVTRCYSQEISLSLKNAPLETVFKEISRQSEFRFVYTSEEVDKSTKVDVNIQKATIDEVLKACFINLPLSYTIDDKIIAVKKKLLTVEPAGLIFIQGRILNDKGEPLPGASVGIKGTSLSTATDENGFFYFSNAPTVVVLIVSNVGYETQEVKWKNDKAFVMRLKQIVSKLEEVIINTGYETLPKERSTGSFVKIDKELYNEQVGTNVISRLEPIVNGLTVYRKQNASGQIMIRGLSTINGPKDPLIILDNFPYEGDFNNINPNDIESVTVLKDAAAASIWGTRAGNGVIVLTTKKGKLNEPIRIEFNANLTVSKKPDLYYLENLNATDYIDIEQFLFSNDYRLSDTSDIFFRPSFTEVYEILLKQRNGSLAANEATTKIDALRNGDVRDEFNNYFYQTGINQQYNISLRGGSSVFSWFASGGYDRNSSDLAEKYRRVNARFDNTYIISKRLALSSGFYITSSMTESGKPAFGTITNERGGLPPYTGFADPNGNPLGFTNKYRQAFIDTIGGGELLDWNYYPLEDYKHNRQTIQLSDLVVNVSAKYKILEGLYADGKFFWERQNSSAEKQYDAESFFTRDLINLYSSIDPFSGQIIRNIPTGGIADLSSNIIQSYQYRGQLNYSKTWRVHQVNAIAGAEVRNKTTSSNANRLYGYDDSNLSFSNVNFVTYYPTIIGFGSFVPNALSKGEIENRFVSLFLNSGYLYNNKYSLTVSARRDASNLFGVKTNNQWTPLWSTGLGWEITKERFFKSRFAGYLKLRATYGFSGNVDPSAVAVTTLSYFDASFYTQGPRAEINRYVNPELRWERVRMLNIGADFKAVGDRVSASIEYYQKKAVDLFGPSPVDYTAGLRVNTVIKNVASMRASGIDVLVNTINLKGPVRWETNFNLNYYKDKITDYYQETSQASFFLNGGAGIGGIEKKPVYAVYSYKWAGLDPLTGDPQGYFGKNITKDYFLLTGPDMPVSELIYHGSGMPTWSGSIGNTISWKGFSIAFRASFKFGHFFKKNSVNYSSIFYGSGGHTDYVNRWQRQGDEQNTNVPSMVFPANSNRDAFYNGSEVLIRKGDHVRLNYINLGYNIKNSEGSAFKNIHIYIVANNLGIIWRSNKDGIDPDFGDSGLLPNKSISAGFSITL